MPSALITGANRGLGLEFARQYAVDGWQVYAACRDPTSALELRRLAETSGHKLRILALDVTDPASVKAAATELDGQAIDLLHHRKGRGHQLPAVFSPGRPFAVLGVKGGHRIGHQLEAKWQF